MNKVAISLQVEKSVVDYVDSLAKDIRESRTFVIETFLRDAMNKRRKIEVSTEVKEGEHGDESAA